MLKDVIYRFCIIHHTNIILKYIILYSDIYRVFHLNSNIKYFKQMILYRDGIYKCIHFTQFFKF